MNWFRPDSLRAGSGQNVPSWFCSQAVSKPVWHIPLLCVQWKTPGDRQRNCPKHGEFCSKNKIWEISASSWFYYNNLSRCTVTWTVKGIRCQVKADKLFIDPLCTTWHSAIHYSVLTPWCRVILQKLTGLQLVKKFPAFYGTRRFITALTSVRHLSLSWASPIQSTYPHPTSWRSILILPTLLCLGLPSGLFPSGFPTKTLYALPLLTHTRHMPSPSHSSRFYHPHNIGWWVQIIQLIKRHIGA